MHSSSEINTLLEQINKNFKEEIVHYRYIKHKPAEYSEPESPINDNLGKVLKKRALAGFSLVSEKNRSKTASSRVLKLLEIRFKLT